MKFRLALFIAGASGFVALSYEILWYRIYAFVSQGAPVAFGALLGAYLIGIAIGSFFSRAFCDAKGGEGALRALGWILVLANTVAFAVAPATGFIVTSSNWVTSLFVVLVATTLLGAVLPLTSHFAIAADDRAGARLSYLYLSNIVGSCLGSLFTGFVAMDHASTRQIGVGLALLGYALATVVFLATLRRGLPLALTLGGVLLASGVVFGASHAAFDQLYERLLLRQEFEPGTHFAETVETKSGVINVTTDGRVWGGGAYDGAFNTELTFDKNWVVRAYAVSALHPRPRRTLMIGLSSGSWAKVLAAAPGLEDFTIVEINPGYLELIARHAEVAGILSDPKVHIVIDDGRRWLEAHPGEKFDAVVMNMTWHWRAHATNLLSQEFFTLVKQHLVPGGLFFFNTTSSKDACKTALASFPHTLRVSNFIAGSDAPLRVDRPAWDALLHDYRIDGRPVLDLASADGQRTLAYLRAYMEPGGEDATLEEETSLAHTCAPGEVVTDDNMRVEWRQLFH